MGAERGEKLRVGEGRAQLRSKACPLTTQERQAQWPGRAGLRRVPGLRSEKSCLFLEKDSPSGAARGQGPPTLRVRPQARPLSSPGSVLSPGRLPRGNDGGGDRHVDPARARAPWRPVQVASQGAGDPAETEPSARATSPRCRRPCAGDPPRLVRAQAPVCGNRQGASAQRLTTPDQVQLRGTRPWRALFRLDRSPHQQEATTLTSRGKRSSGRGAGRRPAAWLSSH